MAKKFFRRLAAGLGSDVITSPNPREKQRRARIARQAEITFRILPRVPNSTDILFPYCLYSKREGLIPILPRTQGPAPENGKDEIVLRDPV